MLFFRDKHNDLIIPMTYLVDLLIVNLFAYFLPINLGEPILFHAYISMGWVVLSTKNKFYSVYRYTKVPTVLRKIFTQFIFFFLLLYAFIGFFKQPEMSRFALAQYFALVFLTVSIVKFIIYIIMMNYRGSLKGSIRNVVVIGDSKKTGQLINVFVEREEYGYNFLRQFSVKHPSFDVKNCLDFIIKNDVDEIYCSVSELKNKELTEFINFADNNLKTLKFIPDNKNIFSKKLKFEYYDYIPILSLRDIPLHNPINSFIKRSFDVVFSGLVIVVLLSWLTPLLGMIIILESKGTVFFRQRRNGVDNREFYCYKFRSMAPNKDADNSSATKNDMRVTKVGKFLRRTSIDELPQFYNVFFGTMSVVGPRPHMVKHTNEYADRIDKYMVRHFVKPGITGLAQVRGYRGEIETETDILNRTKFDIFYIENWSLFLDIKIMVQTIINAFKGEEKAY
ncbi:undecaprenyl-phosphate glucose phosphotransferase [Allomuricauda sp. d1]|uniref:undecaprenyl-phosphate glucose phosphotransferase n=1 Tax=Allomuricauda sp. d1 TaxID=3136725 RepID=UPI0031D16688